MDKGLEFVDAWMKAQKEFMENWVKAQKEFMENWLEATKKMQESILKIGLPPEGTAKETQDLYKSWLTTMVNSSKIFTDEAERVQETWRNTVEKQMEMSREVVKNFSEVVKKAGKKKEDQ
jgi:hypothetical protein